MSARPALIDPAPPEEAAPPLHPLRAWREGMGWTVSEAARRFGVVPQTWGRWERPREDPESRIPSYDDMIRLPGFTGGKVSADDFYPVPGPAGEDRAGAIGAGG